MKNVQNMYQILRITIIVELTAKDIMMELNVLTSVNPRFMKQQSTENLIALGMTQRL